MKSILLGSASPRRREILRFFPLPFRQINSDFDETQVLFQGNPTDFVKQVARSKAHSLFEKYPYEIILTADTAVYRQGRLFLKPKTMQEAYAMLSELSGKQHTVLTGVCVLQEKQEWIDVEETRVELCELTEPQIRSYTKNIEALDKAGGYAI